MMPRKAILFVAEGACLNTQSPAIEGLRFLPGVIRNLFFIQKNLDFELVLVTKQDNERKAVNQNPQTVLSQSQMLDIFANESVTFHSIIEASALPETNIESDFPDKAESPSKKSLDSYLTDDYDLKNSFVIGVDETDIQLAETLGCKGILLSVRNTPETDKKDVISNTFTSWDQISERLFAGERQATVQRTTNETDIFIRLNLDGNGVCDLSTGIGFFDHMLEQLGKHGGLDLTVTVKGDLHVDEHHTIEDTAIALGEAIYRALGSKRGIERYGFCLPMDDCLCSVALDFGGRSWLVWDASFKREKIGDMPTELFSHFFKSLSDAAKMNLHIKAEGENEHHKAEGIFKALAKAIKMAVKRDIYKFDLPTTKGAL